MPDCTPVPLGHSISSHTVFGWCCQCPDRTTADEVVAWRSWAVDSIPDVVAAIHKHWVG